MTGLEPPRWTSAAASGLARNAGDREGRPAGGEIRIDDEVELLRPRYGRRAAQCRVSAPVDDAALPGVAFELDERERWRRTSLGDDQPSAVEEHPVAAHQRFHGNLRNGSAVDRVIIEVDAEQLASVGLHDNQFIAVLAFDDAIEIEGTCRVLNLRTNRNRLHGPGSGGDLRSRHVPQHWPERVGD